MIRVNMDVNPRWYMEFCAQHVSKRGIRRGKPDTIIRRREVINALNRMINRGDKKSKYAQRILEIIR